MKKIVKNLTMLLCALFSGSLFSMKQHEVKERHIDIAKYMPTEGDGEIPEKLRKTIYLLLAGVKRSEKFNKKVGPWSSWGKLVIKKSKNTVYVYYSNGVIDTLYLDKYGRPVVIVYSDKLSSILEQFYFPKSAPYIGDPEKNKLRVPPLVAELKETRQSPVELHDDMFADFGAFQSSDVQVPETKSCEASEGCTGERTHHVLEVLEIMGTTEVPQCGFCKAKPAQI